MAMDFKAGAELTAADLLYYGASRLAEMQADAQETATAKKTNRVYMQMYH